MKAQTRSALKTILATDEEVSLDAIERALAVLNGNPIDRRDFVRVIKIDDAAKILGTTRAAINSYLCRGLLTKVVTPYGGTLGVRSDSLDAFRRRELTPLGRSKHNLNSPR